MEHFLTVLSNIIVKKFSPPFAAAFHGWKLSPKSAIPLISPAGFCRARLPRALSPFASRPSAPQKNATPLGLRFFFKVAGWSSGRIGLRCACPIGFLRGKNPVRLPPLRATKKRNPSRIAFFFKVAGWTRLELATSCVTGRRSNQLNYHPLNFEMPFRHIGALLSIRFLKFFIFALPVFARLGRVSRRSGILYSTSARQKT